MSRFGIGLVDSSSPVIAKEFLDSYADPATKSSYTFASVGTGAASTTREIFVVLAWTSAALRDVTSIYIDGVLATIGTTYRYSAYFGLAVAWATVPTGTAGDVVVAMNGAVTGAAIGVYRVTDRPSLGASHTASAYQVQGFGTSCVVPSIAVPPNGFTLGALVPYSALSGPSVSGLSMAIDDTITADYLMSFASNPIQAAGSSSTQTWTWSTTSSAMAAAWSFS